MAQVPKCLRQLSQMLLCDAPPRWPRIDLYEKALAGKGNAKHVSIWEFPKHGGL